MVAEFEFNASLAILWTVLLDIDDNFFLKNVGTFQAFSEFFHKCLYVRRLIHVFCHGRYLPAEVTRPSFLLCLV